MYTCFPSYSLLPFDSSFRVISYFVFWTYLLFSLLLSSPSYLLLYILAISSSCSLVFSLLSSVILLLISINSSTPPVFLSWASARWVWWGKCKYQVGFLQGKMGFTVNMTMLTLLKLQVRIKEVFLVRPTKEKSHCFSHHYSLQCKNSKD